MTIKQKLIKLTFEYIGGAIAGLGLGVVIGPVLLATTPLDMRMITILGFFLLIVGGAIALYGQSKAI